MGAFCCCFRVRDFDQEDYENNSNTDLSTHVLNAPIIWRTNERIPDEAIPDSEQDINRSADLSTSHCDLQHKLTRLHEQDKSTTSPLKKLGLHYMDSNVNHIKEDDPNYPDDCPTCLEGFSDENPKITTKCNHYFHLACIYEWKERIDTCAICCKAMEFDAT